MSETEPQQTDDSEELNDIGIGFMKLVGGDDIIGHVFEDPDGVFMIKNPMKIYYMNDPRSMSLTPMFTPLVPMNSFTTVPINPDMIVILTDPGELLREYYNDYLLALVGAPTRDDSIESRRQYN